MNALILGAFWLTYYGLVYALSSSRVKSFFIGQLPAVGLAYRILFPLFSGMNFALLFWFHAISPSEALFDPGLSVQIVGMSLGAIALLILVLAVKASRFSFSSREFDSSKDFRQGGIRSIVRYPVYFAALLALVGLFLVFPRWKNISFALASAIYIYIAMLTTERRRIAKYGRIYLEYCNKVKMLIPYLI